MSYMLITKRQQLMNNNKESIQTTQDISQDLLQTNNQTNTTRQKNQSKPQRLQCLDVYRGLTIFGMVVADYTNEDVQGAVWWLIHPRWNGLTCADLVFPSFLFIMGMAIPLAISPKRPVTRKNVLRVVLLFAIGLILNIIEQFNFPQLRIMGILQRMSLCYGIVLFVHWITQYGTHRLKRRLAALCMVGGVLIYMALMLSWSDQSINCPKSNNLDTYCNLAGYVDRKVFSPAHIMEQTDPEGIVPTLTACFTTYVGYCFCLLLQQLKDTPLRLVKYWLTIAALFAVPIYPCSLLMPWNKRLYTVTFMLTVIATSATTLSLIMLLVDILPKTKPSLSLRIQKCKAPLIWLGLNPLAIFVIMSLVSNLVMGSWISWGKDNNPYQAIYEGCFSWMGNYMGTLVYTFLWGIFYTFVAFLLYKRKIFVRL